MNKTCKDCIHEKVCKIRHFPSMFGLTGEDCGLFKDKSRYIELPCAVGEEVYFGSDILSKICPAKVIKIEERYYTPHHPFWITIEYKSEMIGRHNLLLTETSFKDLCYKTKEEAEQVLKGGAE